MRAAQDLMSVTFIMGFEGVSIKRALVSGRRAASRRAKSEVSTQEKEKP
jgi:hypothetical protein